MREIKFRAWLKEYETMTDIGGFYKPLVDSEGKGRKLIRIFNSSAFDANQYEGEEKEIVLMQFVGKSDKKGTLIYEGDIMVEHTGKNPTEKSIYYKGYVVYDKASTSFELKTISSKRKNTYRHNSPNDLKIIIGNIYENPELIKK